MMLKARNLAAVLLGAALLLPTAAMAGSSYGSGYGNGNGSGYGNNYDRDHDRDRLAHGGSHDWRDYKKSPYGYDDGAHKHAKKYSKKQYKKHLKKQHAAYPSRRRGQGNHYGWRKNSRKKQQGHYGHNHVHQQGHYGHRHSHHQARQSDIYRLTHYVLKEILERPRY